MKALYESIKRPNKLIQIQNYLKEDDDRRT